MLAVSSLAVSSLASALAVADSSSWTAGAHQIEGRNRWCLCSSGPAGLVVSEERCHNVQGVLRSWAWR